MMARDGRQSSMMAIASIKMADASGNWKLLLRELTDGAQDRDVIKNVVVVMKSDAC
jgi:hypothetical protein